MNETVDFNELKFLCLLVMLTAEICYQFKDFNRSIYFFNEARKFASYSCLFNIKTDSLIAIGQISIELKLYD